MKVASKILMMKSLLGLLLIAIESGLYAQTDSIEKAAIHAQFLSQKISQEAYSEVGINWNLMVRKIKKYPDLPLDQSGQVHYLFLNKYKDISKEKLFHRVLESLSINNGIYPANVYSNLEDGKIIFKNGFPIDANYTCNYATVITIKNEKILLEFINIEYQAFYQGHYSGDSWVPDKNVNFNINHFYPIILKKSTEWEWNLNLFKTTNEYFQNEVDKLYGYLIDYDSNYVF
jgi:hypothetical protein